MGLELTCFFQIQLALPPTKQHWHPTGIGKVPQSYGLRNNLSCAQTLVRVDSDFYLTQTGS